jgi:mannose-6-phosphate isomerase-like protein (cupin superfamily)
VSQTPAPKSNEPPIDQLVAAPLAGRSLGLAESNFNIAEWADRGAPPRPRQLIAPLHVHHGDDEAWYVLAGTLAFQLGDQEIEAPAGTLIFAPRRLAHTYWNPHPEPARYLLIMTPNIRQLIADLHAATDRSREAQETVYHQHNSDVLYAVIFTMPASHFAWLASLLAGPATSAAFALAPEHLLLEELGMAGLRRRA